MELGDLIDGLYLENTILDSDMRKIIAVDEYESSYFKESGNGEGFFKRVIEAFKKFVNNIIEKIKAKMQEHQFKRAIDKMKKAGIKSLDSKFLKALPNKKQCMDLNKKYIKVCAEAVKKIYKAKSSDEIEKAWDIVNDYYEKYADELEECVLKSQSEFNSNDLDQISAIEQTNILVTATVENMKNICYRYSKEYKEYDDNYWDSLFGESTDDTKEVSIDEKNNVVKRITNKIIQLGQKTVNFLSKHQTAIIGAIGVASGVIVTANVMKKNNAKEVKKQSSLSYLKGKQDENQRLEKAVDDRMKKMKNKFNDLVKSGKITIN